MATDRTAPFQKIRPTVLSRATDQTAKTITHTIEIPGITRKDGHPLTVDTTFTIDEIDADWISVVRDFEFCDGPVAYGNHPHAIGALREVLPEAYPLPDFPADRRDAQKKLYRMLSQHDLGGTVFLLTDSIQVCIRPPRWSQLSGLESEDARQARWIATIREYLPFKADMWWDESADVIRVRPARERKDPVVRIA